MGRNEHPEARQIRGGWRVEWAGMGQSTRMRTHPCYDHENGQYCAANKGNMIMATVPELNAGFDAAMRDLKLWLVTLVPDRTIPFVGNIRSLMLAKLDSPEGHARLLELVRDVTAAEEK